jgi:hypothetical protein
VTATLCPALALYLAQHGGSQAYCGVGEHGWGYLCASALACWIGIDFFEFYYHHMGHTHAFFWAQHKARAQRRGDDERGEAELPGAYVHALRTPPLARPTGRPTTCSSTRPPSR